MTKISSSKADARGRSAATMSRPIEPGSVDTRLLSVFEAVMDECSFSRAAKRLGITQSAVSQAIARLRSIAGDELFERTGQGVRPTPRAFELDQPIRQAMGLLRSSLSSPTVFDPRTTRRTFHLTMLPSVVDALSPELYDLLHRPSKLRLQITPLDLHHLEVGMRHGEPEIAVLRDPIDAPGFRSERLATEKFVLVARRQHSGLPQTITWECYADLDHIVFALYQPSDMSIIDREFERRRVRRSVPLALPTVSSILRVVEKTDLVSTMGDLIVNRLRDRYDVAFHALPFDDMQLPLFMAWHERFDNDGGHMWLREGIRSLFRNSAEGSGRDTTQAC